MIVSNLKQRKEPIKKTRQVRKQYSGGFKGYTVPQKDRSMSNSSQMTTASAWIQKLGIKNMAALYEQHKAQEEKALLKRKKQEQVRKQKQVDYQRKKKQKLQPASPHHSEQDRNKEQQQQKQVEKKKFNDLYEKDYQYDLKAEYYLLSKELNEIYKDIERVYINNATVASESFKNSLVHCIFLQQEKIYQGGELLNIFQQYLMSSTEQKNRNIQFTYEKVQKLRKANMFLCVWMKPKQNMREQKGKKEEITEKLEIHSGHFHQDQMEEVASYFKNPKKYTVPFKFNISGKQVIVQRNKSSEQEAVHQKIKANPIPKTIYEPETFKKPMIETTKLQPFNLSEPNKNQPLFDEYYQWDTSFHPNPVPKTTYKPQQIYRLTEKQKKVREKIFLEKASYPKSMNYLNHLNQHKQNVVKQLQQKYHKQRDGPERKEIPDFNNLHARNLISLDARKKKNQKEIKVQPFDLSKNRAKKIEEPVYQKERPKSTKVRQSDLQIAKSTLKHDQYVEYRKKQNEKKQLKIEKSALERQKRSQSTAHHKIILKQKMREYLETSEQKNKYEPSNPAKVNVNYDRVYWEEPLLIERSHSLPWYPIF